MPVLCNAPKVPQDRSKMTPRAPKIAKDGRPKVKCPEMPPRSARLARPQDCPATPSRGRQDGPAGPKVGKIGKDFPQAQDGQTTVPKTTQMALHGEQAATGAALQISNSRRREAGATWQHTLP